MAVAKLLTKQGADVNTRTHKGKTAAELSVHSVLTDYSGSKLIHNS